MTVYGCPFCLGASALLSRGGHEPGCPAAQQLPVTNHKPQAVRPEPPEEF